MPTTTITANASQYSQPIVVAAFSRITAVNGYVEYAVGDQDTIRNNVATWVRWPLGAVAGSANTMASFIVRLVGTANSATLTAVEPDGPVTSTNGRSVGAYWATDSGRLYNSAGYAIQGGVYQLAQGAVPYGIANSGTIATNGTYTAGTAYSTTYAGVWLYFPITAFATLPAGFYWCVASSTTVFQVYTSDTSGVLVVGSNSAFTGDTTQRTAVSVTIPGGAIGANGSIRHHAGHTINNTAGNKVTSTFFGSTSIFTATGTTNTNMGYEAITTNKNNQSSQRTSNLGVTGATAQGSFSTIDTSVDSALSFRLQLAVATDVLVLENWLVEVLPN